MTVAPTGLSDRQIAGCFNRNLGRRYRVRLLGGAVEPLYMPGGEGWALIRYTRDYPASALHELAHWCIAGARRRALADYGYWYRPPPRSPEEQAAFLGAEVPVQALESCFAAACGLDFRVSLDDLQAEPLIREQFAAAVAERAARMTAGCLGPRSGELLALLSSLYARQVRVAGPVSGP